MKSASFLRGYGPLTCLAILFAVSSGIRLFHGVGAALALEASESPEMAGAPLQCEDPPARLMEAIRQKDASVKAREAALQDRLAALALAEDAIAARLAEMAHAEASLRETLAIADGAAEKDLARLTAVYESMKPAEAAALFEAMAPEFAAGFLGRMRPEAAAAVLSGMSPDAAYSISVLVAGRNALAPTE